MNRRRMAEPENPTAAEVVSPVLPLEPAAALRPPGAETASSQASRQSFLRSALAVGAITFLSRITGLFREYTHAHFLGTGTAADAFRIALLIPNVLRRLVGEGAISSAFVPVFTRHIKREDPQAVRVFAEKFFTLWTAILAVVTLVGMALAGWGLRSLEGMGVAWSPEKLELTLRLTRWLFPYLALVGLSAVAGGILNAFGIFGLPSATPLLYNLAFIAGGWLLSGFFPGERAVYGFMVGVLLGGTLQLGILLPPLFKMGIRFRPSWPGGHAGVREVLRLLIPGTFGAGIYQLNVMIAVFLAMRLPQEGPVAALGYAGRLMEFVLGVFVFALSTVSLTTLSAQAAEGDRQGFRATLSEVLRLTAFITIPSTVGLFVLRKPVIALLFKSGRFDEESARLTASIFQCYVPGLFVVGVNRVLVAAFYALKDIRTPVRVGAVNLAVNAGFAMALMGPLAHLGIALASTVAACVQSIWLLSIFARRQPDLLAGREILASLGRVLLASAVLWALCAALLPLLPGEERGKLALGLGVGGVIAAGLGVYFAAARLLGGREAAAFGLALGRRRGR
jgi:putative peptidoglycan lipid II flippase